MVTTATQAATTIIEGIGFEYDSQRPNNCDNECGFESLRETLLTANSNDIEDLLSLHVIEVGVQVVDVFDN